ncbi:MAG: hypothetical protein H6R15_3287 [Proteobacteria bacterium]|nr:hypothetical protein [Pseudomonadota bacterium]
MPPLLITMLFAAFAVIVAANLLATLRIIRCDFDSTAQRAAQLAFVWCLPVIGAVIVFFLTRANLEPHAGCYPKKKEEPDDVVVAQPDYSSSD